MPLPHDVGAGKVAVVDDDVRQGLRTDFSEIDHLADTVAVPVHPGRFLEPLGGAVTGDAAPQRDLTVYLQPDALFPAVVIFRAERENRIHDQDRACRGADSLVPVVLPRQRVMPAQHHHAGPSWACGPEQQVSG